ncbi:DUF423 domain-containing protein [Tuberibacillus sp. Marseille-P3662]|uniref:DUF423 domain-containing protein n=1 Tax=Tuberibacillus sp. Marseille-P3662 TaxID=1965358 RepID=UPI000A1C85CC|nr:DUF423 domain-containing protein [Tuberibacillus sp. Marseille-P3662]
MKLFTVLGSINAFLAVALGAFGAHALKDVLTDQYESIWNTAVQYHMMHAVGLILIGVLSEKVAGQGMMQWAGWLMFAGIIFFSGSLYVLSVTQISKLGAITPIGGIGFLAAWLLVIIAFIK